MNVDVDILIVGAGISGIGAGIELLRRDDRSFLILEAEAEPGGTWRDNTYPGVAVDIPSVSYCYPFETDFPWSRVFAPGAEIQRYVLHCADKHGVTEYIRCDAKVVRSEFDETHDTWATRLENGSLITSRFVIAATGLLSQPKLPEIPGLDTFVGKVMHTARWEHDHDLTSRRVAVIGTGASAVQVVPEIAPRIAELRVFQRTPTWVAPRFDRMLTTRRASLRLLPVVRTMRRFVSEAGIEFLSFAIVNFRRLPFIVRIVQRSVRHWMLRQVHDPETAMKLLPGYGLGCKRPTTSNGYLQAFNRGNVRLVTEPITRICAHGIVTKDQALHEVDTIILATGFLTTERGNAPSFEVVGSDGVEMGQLWQERGRQSYAGVSLHGFPNFFLTAGPYSGGFNWFTMLDAHLGHIVACITECRARGVSRVEVKPDAHQRYMRHMLQRSENAVFKDASCATANSYYIDRRGDASLPFPHTPWWRVVRERCQRTRDYNFGAATAAGAAA